MFDEQSYCTRSVVVEASEEQPRTPPQWWAQFVTIAGAWQISRFFGPYLARKRAGQYVLTDFLLVLVGYAISGECTLPAFYAAVEPVREAFTALWGRTRLPVACTLSRSLSAVISADMEAVRSFF